jgi:NADH-quinone oxidoreductase subunit G
VSTTTNDAKPEVKMVSVTIEGRTTSVPEGTTIIEAAKTVGVLIPHYCYHPGLPVAGVCRMCLVDVEKFPKLAPACATTVMEGQVVSVHSEKAREARKGVLEFLLINHPLDCPVCDQSGECELQDYTFQEGRAESRYEEPKRFNPVEDFGGDVLYVPNRCILCTRCVRFMGDVAEEPVLNVSERGDRAFIGKAEGHDLTHAWAGNVVDLCPVGALLSKDFLNKARAWELDRSASICTGCSQGCNVTVETRDNTVVRLKPRSNTAVNHFYLCESGRLDYRWINRRDRLDQPKLRVDGEWRTVDWEDALDAAAATLAGKRVTVLASPNCSNETLFLAERIIAQQGGSGVFRVTLGAEAPLRGVDDLSLRAERAANATGARLLGYRDLSHGAPSLSAHDVLLILDDALEGELSAALTSLLSSGATVLHVGTTLPAVLEGQAQVALPIANHTEEEGTFTNLRGRVQRFLQARTAPGLARPSWYVMSDLVERLGAGEGRHMASAVFDQLAATHASFASLSYATLALRGLPVVDAAERGLVAPMVPA